MRDSHLGVHGSLCDLNHTVDLGTQEAFLWDTRPRDRVVVVKGELKQPQATSAAPDYEHLPCVEGAACQAGIL